MTSKIILSGNLEEAQKNRFKRFFRFDNSKYWLDYYSLKAASDDTSREKVYAEIMARYVGKAKKVVDVACGMGFFLKELHIAGLKVEGVDLFPEMVEYAKKYLLKTGVKVHNCDILSMPYADRSLDGISLISIIEHFPLGEVKRDILPEVGKKLKKGGFVFVHCPVRTPMSMLTRTIRRYVLRDLPSWAIDDDGDITHKIWLTPEEYIKLFQSKGFELVNYDSRLTRSNLKPLFLSRIMIILENLLGKSDPKLVVYLGGESLIIKVLKKLKSQLALTSYFLFKKT